MAGYVRKHIFISGRVQGVGFRAFILRNAEKYGVKGWVKNVPDGRVEAVLSGTEDRVQRVIDLARLGPGWGWVERVDVIDVEYKDEFSGFHIKF